MTTTEKKEKRQIRLTNSKLAQAIRANGGKFGILEVHKGEDLLFADFKNKNGLIRYAKNLTELRKELNW